MEKLASCPSRARLGKLLEGTLSDKETARVVRHVDHCDRCQAALDEMTSETATLLRQYTPDARETEPALRQAMERLASEPNMAERTVEPSLPQQLSLDFLSRSENPQHLGRLGSYEILEVIGSGGMGIVLKAFDPALNRTVAIKVLAPPLALSDVARKRFIREARAAAAINHDNVVTIYAVDEANGLPYLVMQHVAGASLEKRLESAAGPLELKEIVRIGKQIAAGLAAAHAQGLIHRDIKPANILLENAGLEVGGLAQRQELERVRITDFGLARAIDDASVSQSGVVSGTPMYMSPEQISAGAIDHRSDLYALGVLLYRMATGREPFVADTFSKVWSQHLFERPASPSEIAPMPAWLEHLLLGLLQKDPAARPQTAEEVIRLLSHTPPATLNQHEAPTSAGPIPLPANEEARLAALREYRILDTDPEQAFDDLALLASHVCGTPIALITLVDADRQWFKSKVGLSLKETARNISFCTHTIMQPEALQVRDALDDERFASSPLVHSAPHVRFYAGMPLITPEGHALGAMCVMDHVPRQLSADQVSALAALSRLVLFQLQLRRDLLHLKDALAAATGR
jgi:serine/threonine protein kinase